MCRVALGAAAALAALVATSGVASAEDDYVWRRLNLGHGATVWVAAEDLASGPQRDGYASVHVLWTHPTQRGLPRGTRYVMSEYTFDCGAGGVREDIFPFDAADQPLEDMGETEEREVNPRSAVGAVFAMVCEGAEYEDDIELGSAREVLDYEASGRGAPSRAASGWDQGPSRPDDEPVEPREPQAPGGQP